MGYFISCKITVSVTNTNKIIYNLNHRYKEDIMRNEPSMTYIDISFLMNYQIFHTYIRESSNLSLDEMLNNKLLLIGLRLRSNVIVNYLLTFRKNESIPGGGDFST